MDHKDLEKIALLDAIQTTACHCIDPKALKTCPYHEAVNKARETIQDEVSADIARDLGLDPKGTRCPSKKG